MKLECVKASDIGLSHGWAVVSVNNGGIVAHSPNEDSGFAWMRAAENLAEAMSDIQRTIYGVSPQQFRLLEKLE